MNYEFSPGVLLFADPVFLYLRLGDRAKGLAFTIPNAIVVVDRHDTDGGYGHGNGPAVS